ncbi:MAG: HlyD family efflux transporter periplasmic adaptor subunit [Pirellula sp.]
MSARIWTKAPWVIGVLIIGGLLVYGFLPSPIDVELSAVHQGTLIVTVNDEGETRVRERYVVSVPVAGNLQRLELHVGDSVVRNQTELAKISSLPPSLLDARTVAELRAKEGAAIASVERAEAHIKSVAESLGIAQHDFERAKSLIASQSISKAEYDAADHQLQIAVSNQRAALFSKRIAEFELETARALLARNSITDRENEAAVSLVSPIDGRVLRVLREDAGVVTAGEELLVIGDLNDMEVQIEVLSQDAVRILPGAKMVIEQWGGDRTLTGRVRSVEPFAFLKISALGVEEKRVRVVGDLVGNVEERTSLGDGYRIEARIEIQETSAESLLIPSGTLCRDSGLWSVYRVDQGFAKLTRVPIGATNGLETQVVSGLQVGDLVIRYPSDKVRDGVRVREMRN